MLLNLLSDLPNRKNRKIQERLRVPHLAGIIWKTNQYQNDAAILRKKASPKDEESFRCLGTEVTILHPHFGG